MMDRSHFPQGAARAASPLAEPTLREPVSLEVPVRLQGDSPELSTFFEDTNTVLVFPEGAVLRVAGQLNPGQRVLLTNRNTRQQLSCRVVYARPYLGAKGYAEVEFAAAVPGFWEGTAQSASGLQTVPVRSQVSLEARRAAVSFAQLTPVAEPVADLLAVLPGPRTSLARTLPSTPVVAPRPVMAMPSPPPAVDDIEKLLASHRAESEAEAKEAARAASAFADQLLSHPPVLGSAKRSRRVVWVAGAIAAALLATIGASAGTWGWRSEPVSPAAPTAPAPPDWSVPKPVIFQPESLAEYPLRKLRANSLIPMMLPHALEVAAEMRRRMAESKMGAPVVRRTALAEAALPDVTAASAGSSPVHAPTLALVPVVGLNVPAPPPAMVESKLKPLKLIYSRAPVYPAIARRAGVQGEVLIHARVDEKGNVTAMQVVSGPATLRQSALDAVQMWKYESATLNGKPVSVDTVISVKFQL